MNSLEEIKKSITETTAAIYKFTKIQQENPDDFSVELNLESLQKRLSELEKIYYYETSLYGLDVCTYRLTYNEKVPKLRNITESLTHFQNLFSLVFDARNNGPKDRSSINSEIINQTSFDYGFSFVGSIGFSLTLPNEILMLMNSKVDESLEILFNMMNSESSEEILAFCKQLGKAPIRSLYKWVEQNANSGVGLEIKWQREEEIRSGMFASNEKFKKIQQIILETSEEEYEDIAVVGFLVGADIPNRTFHMSFDELKDIRGSFDHELEDTFSVELPRKYEALIRKTTKINYSTDEEKATYHLLKLVPV